MTNYNLENRLIEMGVLVLNYTRNPGPEFGVQHLFKQLARSASSAALNYGEAQSAESRKDFIHKLKLSLKELRESRVNLLLLTKSNSRVSMQHH